MLFGRRSPLRTRTRRSRGYGFVDRPRAARSRLDVEHPRPRREDRAHDFDFLFFLLRWSERASERERERVKKTCLRQFSFLFPFAPCSFRFRAREKRIFFPISWFALFLFLHQAGCRAAREEAEVAVAAGRATGELNEERRRSMAPDRQIVKS